LVAFPDEALGGDGRRFTVRLINRTDAAVGFVACDSCLYLTQEALDRFGNWRPIELSPTPICGNSFHRVFLDRNPYWAFSARHFNGTFQTKLRFRLDQGTCHRFALGVDEQIQERPVVRAEPGGVIIYSNEFDGWVNESLFWFAPGE